MAKTRLIMQETREAALAITREQRKDAQRSPFSRRFARFARRARLLWVRRMAGFGFLLTGQFRVPAMGVAETMNAASALVNYFSFQDAPPLMSFKPSSLPMNGAPVNVTLGRCERRPVVVGDDVVVRRVMPLFVRADHRIVHSHQIASFVTTLCTNLANPALLVDATEHVSEHESSRAA